MPDSLPYDTGGAQPIPLPTNDKHPNSLGQWRTRIEASEDILKQKMAEWKANMDAYHGKTLLRIPEQHTVVVPKDFSFTEQKKSQLFFQTPEIQLTALQKHLEASVLVFQARVNHELGPAGVDVMSLMEEVMFDVLCPSGVGVSKIGYETVVDGYRQISADGTQSQDPMNPSPMEQVPNVVFEQYFWRRIAPGKLRFPDTFRGSDFDDADWLGFEFEMDALTARKMYNLEKVPSQGSAAQDEFSLSLDKPSVLHDAKKAKGWEIWYKASRFDDQEKHPNKLRLLVLLDGVDVPVRHEDSPYQRVGPDGRLGGMEGFPIHVLTLRFSDSALPPSDCTQSRAQVDELSIGRSQMILQRDRSIPLRVGDINRLGGQDGLDKLRANIWQSIIPVSGLDSGNPPIVEIARAVFPPENFRFNEQIEKDIGEIWAMGANQLGMPEQTVRSATESSIIQQNSVTRLQRERNRVFHWFTNGVAKLASLIQMYDDQTDYVRVVGPDGIAQLQPWDQQAIQGKFAYAIKPDSGIPVDANQERQNAINTYQMMINDPAINRIELISATLRKLNLDPQRMLLQEQPEKGPEPPNISYRFSGEDLDPNFPRFPIVMEILRLGGINISPEAIKAAQDHARKASLAMNQTVGVSAEDTGQGTPPPETEHGGLAEQQRPLEAHSERRTGEMPGPPVGGTIQ
jgi:hypothetical protein